METSKTLQDLFYQYTHLHIGGKEIVCPYWMNNLEKRIYGPIGGKGTPREIEETTAKEAEAENVNLEKLDKEAIALFMKAKKIGVDCSGFVFWMLNALDLEKGGNGIVDDIAKETRASVQVLTDENVSIPIKLKDVKVGDMLKLGRGKHVVIVHKIVREGEEIKEIWYAHSSGRTKITGVHEAKIVIFDQNGEIGDQEWEELTGEGVNYGKDACFTTAGDGLRRLRLWF